MTTPKMAPHQIHTDHTHAHSDACGHRGVNHDDHVDYLHDGHFHRLHGEHWDECRGPAEAELRERPAP
ncbi:hypothetical protein [Micromonospora sp. NPDC049679]|uniref:hypothetical protein n=1 Tax=Micromonospora sp. NPDC049679 TaxID=3155920 RepID=UPI0033F68AC6